MNEDPYQSITNECRISILQEEKLGRSGFAFEPVEEEPEPEEPVRVTGITMVSLPGSESEHMDEEIFHTPPEQHQSRSVSSCDAPGPEIRPGTPQSGRKCVGDVFVEGVVCDDDESGDEVDLKGKKVDSKFNGKNVIDTEMVDTEVVILSDEENCDNVVDNAKCESSRGRFGRKNAEDLDAVRDVSRGGVGTSRGVSGRRTLPNSFKEQKENEGLWVPRSSVRDRAERESSNKPFNCEMFEILLASAGIVFSGGTDTDYMKAARENGLVFYRPRWWPIEGFGN
ncbi:hypothetical protein DCAR_0209419 [Daucus carota subsp. sativus]|uniref:Uncharacterized protein n=1 Tax=Daucus carota subsp. sativus TaxID=79200 RepID=A0A166F942_DAUCS|nr:PREDICTED: uncharacterized protein LOC108206622 [Daucus carota subsp. sativus]WOG90176.1 hypothetical protein DCAR_0209419 [Daucus carota subsp. sativus]